MVLGKIDFDGELAQQLYSSGNLYGRLQEIT